MPETIGILHPGEMGISIAACAQKSGHPVAWVSEGRSPQTRKRAETQGLSECLSLEELCQISAIILSVCPPHAAEEVANQVRQQAFHGIYADLNAISPMRAKQIARTMEKDGIEFVDGGIIGGPAWEQDSTWLYLSGRKAERIAACFSAGPLRTQVIGEEIGRASALKMCYGGYTKGRTALLCGILATAESLGVRELLEQEWGRNDPGFVEETNRQVSQVTRKAWRFAGEMEEVAATFQAAGLPEGFHAAAGEIYRRMAGFKDRESLPEVAEVLERLQGKG